MTAKEKSDNCLQEAATATMYFPLNDKKEHYTSVTDNNACSIQPGLSYATIGAVNAQQQHCQLIPTNNCNPSSQNPHEPMFDMAELKNMMSKWEQCYTI